MIPEELLARVDERALSKFMSRSDYIRHTLHNAIIEADAKEPSKAFESIDPKWLNVDDS